MDIFSLRPENLNLNYKGDDGIIVSVRIPKTINSIAEVKAEESLASKSSIFRDLLVKGLTPA